ncbi:hypothetical protein NL50_03730 [Clostridium acetobutylicum]|nr:hypothetical protein NL50_03730 [Clostridium acetobutylicum]
MIIVITTVMVSFLCGSIPTGYLITKKLSGIDVRTKGSGNIGSTNVKRVAGTKISMITQVMDILKGIIPVLLCMLIASKIKLPISTSMYLSIIVIAVILGHDYTPFLGFNGGKGVNTTVGAFFLLAPAAVLAGAVVYFVLRLFTKIVSIKSIAVGITMPIACIVLRLPIEITVCAIIACGLLILRHKDNLIRLVHNEEK